MDSRAKIIDAAVQTLATVGFEHTSVRAVADRAHVSRPTVYSYFPTREELISAAIEHAASSMVARVNEEARNATTAADFAVHVVVATRREFLANRALAPMVYPELGSLQFARGSVSRYAIELARKSLFPLIEYDPELEDEMDEIAETVIRFLFSFVLFESDTSASEERLRRYLYRRLVPALGLEGK